MGLEGAVDPVGDKAVDIVPGGSDAEKGLAFFGGVRQKADGIGCFHHSLLYFRFLQVGAVDVGVGIASAAEEVEIGVDLGEVQFGERAGAAHDIPAEGAAEHHELDIFFVPEGVTNEEGIGDDREGSAEDIFRNAEGSGSGVDNNHRIIRDKGCRRFPDGFFFGFVLGEGIGDDTRCHLGNHGSPGGSGEPALFFQSGEIGTDGHLGHGEARGELFYGEIVFLLQETENFILTLGEIHKAASFQWPADRVEYYRRIYENESENLLLQKK